MSARIAQLQQQVLTYQDDVRRIRQMPFVAPASDKKESKKKKEKQPASQANTNTNGNTNLTYAAVATAAATSPVPMATDTTGWTTLKVGSQKDKKILTSKLIPTTYAQAEREVTCHFIREQESDTILAEQDYATRQLAADIALRHVNSAIVNKDVFTPAFIRARVTVHGNIVFTTGNNQTNVIYEDYTIIKDTLSYYSECEKVEIGRRFSQFLLHGVPTHLSPPKVSQSISSNYPQLIQSQAPRWLMPADRREHKANSTIVMTLTGNIKKVQIGRQHLIVCNRQCELDDYIAYGRNTQCRKCQAYSHPAALCRNDSRCASVPNPMRRKSTPALSQFARRAQPALTPRSAAPTVTHLTRRVTPTVLSGLTFAKLPKQTRMQPPWETPQKWEWPYRMALLASVGSMQLLNCAQGQATTISALQDFTRKTENVIC